MKFVIGLITLHALWASPAYAYLDPGTGSMVIQMAIAGILSLTFAIKTYWYRIKSFLTGTKLEEEEENITDESEQDD